jgi:hypothetical protein
MTVEDVTRSTHATALAIVVAALDFAALDDITTGHEPSLWMEWTFMAASVPLLWLLWHASRRSKRGRT